MTSLPMLDGGSVGASFLRVPSPDGGSWWVRGVCFVPSSSCSDFSQKWAAAQYGQKRLLWNGASRITTWSKAKQLTGANNTARDEP